MLCKEGETVAVACVAGDSFTMGADTLLNVLGTPTEEPTKQPIEDACTEPGEGQYVTAVCVPAGVGTSKVDTVIESCTQQPLGAGAVSTRP